MTIEKKITRDYKFTDALLKQTADKILLNLNRDSALLLPRGITVARITAYSSLISEFDDAPTDEELLGEVIEATQTKDETGEKLRVGIRTVRTFVDNTFGTGSGHYRIYKFERLNKTPEETLHRLARTVVRVATKQLVDHPSLGNEGLTQAMVDNVDTVDLDFDKAIDKQHAAMEERDIKSEELIIKGNKLYKETMKMCNIGKDLFASTDPARYNDYIIYNTVNAKAPEPGTSGRMRGIATDSVTGAPIDGVLIFYPEVEEPIETDEDGEYSNDVVNKNTITFTATHPDYEDFTGTFTIVPDEEIIYDFMMTPKPE